MDIDTSSYPKPTQGKSILETAGQLGALKAQSQQIQSQAISIDKQKLDLMDQQYGIINKEMLTLMNKGDKINQDDIVGTARNLVKAIPTLAEPMSKFIAQIPTPQQAQQNPNAYKDFVQNAITRAQTVMDAVKYHYGAPGTVDTGQTIQPVATSPKPGFGGIRSTGAPIQVQPPPTMPVVGPTGQPQALGAQPPQLAPGTVAAPPPMGGKALPVGPIDNPAIKGPSANFGGNVLGAVVEPPQPTAAQNVQDRFPTPRGPMTGAPPMFEEGRKQLAADQELATQKLTAIKPALQALPLMKDLMASGPGTGQFTTALAALSNAGMISKNVTDKVAAQQEVIKKLAQYVASNPVGQRSDAAQTLAEAGSPTPKVQILPALIKLTKDSIILDRVQAARPNAFESQDLSKYGNHRSAFPATIDERAFGLDLMEPKERNDLLVEMKKKQNTAEGKKFKKSLEIVDKLGYIDYK